MSLASATDHLPVTSPVELNLKDYLDVVRRRKAVFIQTFALVMAVGIVITALSKPVYRTQGKMSVPVPQNTVLQSDAANPLNAVLIGIQPSNINTQLQALQSGHFLKEAAVNAHLSNNPNVVPPSVRVEALEGTQVINVAVEGGSPPDIKAFCTAIMELHQKKMKLQSEGNVDKAADFVKGLLRDQSIKLARIEAKLVAFRQTHRVIERQEEAESRARKLAELDARVRAALADIATTTATLNGLRSRLAQQSEYLEEEQVRDNSLYQKRQEKLDALRDDLEEAQQQFKPTSRQVTDIQAKVNKAEQTLKDTPLEIRSKIRNPNPMRTTLQTQIINLEGQLLGQQEDYNSSLAQLRAAKGQVEDGSWEVELNRLNRERSLLQDSYTQLSQQYQQLQIRQATGPQGIEFLEVPGLPQVPVRPRREVNIALTTILALFLAAGMAFLQEYLDDRVNAPEDVERLTALPTLGHVPLIEGDQPRLVTEMAANSHIAEAYRALRSGIGFAALDAPIKRIQVTSASKGEGKSTTSVNLATAMAMDGKRVILVDADLRRPSVHRVLEVPSSPGLSEVLIGLKTLEESLQDTPVENLRVLCAGPIPPNPAELLGSAAFDRVIEQLDTLADVVVFDTPPCMPVTDPLIVSSRMDGVVLVLHAGSTRKAAVKHVVQQLTRARARIIGAVFNRVQPRKGGYYYYHYYYSGDGYYADAAARGDRHRRNGKRKNPALHSGRAVATTARGDDDDD